MVVTSNPGGRHLVVIPTYNERGNVARMYQRIRSQGLVLEMLFVDDASPDGTGEVLDELAANDPLLHVLHRPKRLGIGSAHRDGIRWAYDHGVDVLVTMDGDFSHSPEDIERLLSCKGSAVTVGSRFSRPGSLPGWNLLRRGLTHAGHMLTQLLLRVPYDATGAFRVYRLGAIPSQIFDLVEADGYAFFFESLFLLHLNGLPISEVPIVLPARTYGHSKMSWVQVLRSTQRVISLGVARISNPSRFRLPRDSVLDEPVEDWQDDTR